MHTRVSYKGKEYNNMCIVHCSVCGIYGVLNIYTIYIHIIIKSNIQKYYSRGVRNERGARSADDELVKPKCL